MDLEVNYHIRIIQNSSNSAIRPALAGNTFVTCNLDVSRIEASLYRNCESRANKILITVDGGGSNGSRVKLWKTELQALATELNIEIHVSHFPPGTSKWNKIEHRLFSYISSNWRGQPLISHEVIIQLISATTTRTGLKVFCELDTNSYETGIKVSDEELANVNIEKDKFHGEWNYIVKPKN